MNDKFKSVHSWVNLERLKECPNPTVVLQQHLRGAAAMRSAVTEVYCNERFYIGLMRQALTTAGFDVLIDPHTFVVIAPDEVVVDLLSLTFPGIVVEVAA